MHRNCIRQFSKNLCRIVKMSSTPELSIELFIYNNLYHNNDTDREELLSRLQALMPRMEEVLIELMSDNRYPLVVRKAVDYIDKYFTQTKKIQGDAIAVAVGMDRSALSKLFKSCLGSTIHQYVNQLRLIMAVDRLTTTQHPIAAIAEECGFQHESHLIRLFSREFTVSPSRYRQLIVPQRVTERIAV